MKKFSVLKTRIRDYAKYKGIELKKIYKDTKMSDGTLSNDSGLGEDNLLTFLAYATDINLQWFFTGKGPILRAAKLSTDWEERLQNIELRLQQQETHLQLINEELDAIALLEVIKKDNTSKKKVKKL